MGALIDRMKARVPPPVKRAVRRVLPDRRERPEAPLGDSPPEPSADPLWHRRAVGGLWEEIGRLQFEFMVAQGLRPTHRLLDVGCGSLRGGVHFVGYLEPGNYYGIDIDERLLAAGEEELRQRGLLARRPVLVRMDDFSFASLGERFEYALAQSVFTHLPLNSIIRCLVSIAPVLRPGGRFYATFFEHPAGKGDLRPVRRPTSDATEIVSHFDRDPYHYDVDTFRWACEGTGLELRYVGEWDHPRGQNMLLFRKP